ncbi:glycosyltransferase [Actinophytocola xinjiangensis]|uniref:glycosyltransferase n=1 Tax=Actinophytocola xinjiangensis TaxID=485602 RepID=UPI000A9CC3FE
MRDLAAFQAREFDTEVLVPQVRGGQPVENVNGMTVRRFRYFPRRWEDLAHGAIIENLRTKKSRWLQVPPFFLSEIIALRRAVRRHRPDVVHVHWMIPQGVSALLAARKVPWVVTTLGGDVYALKDPVSRRLKRAVLRRASAVTTMNEDMRQRLIDLGADADTTTVLPMGADVDTIRAAGAGVDREPGRIMFVGRLVEKKGAAVLLTALRALADLPGWQLDVIGDGPLRAELERQAQGLPVTFHGQAGRAQLAAVYARAQIAVFPSKAAASGDQDGLPVALLEAMSAGPVVVASRIPGIDAAVVDRESGVLVAPDDADALAGVLRELLGDAGLRERLSAGGTRRAQEFSVDALGARYCALLHEVAGR